MGLWLNVSYKMYSLFVSRIQNVYAHPTFQKVQSSTNLILAISGKHFIFHFVFYPQDCLNVLDLTFFGVKIKRNSAEISKKKFYCLKNPNLYSQIICIYIFLLGRSVYYTVSSKNFNSRAEVNTIIYHFKTVEFKLNLDIRIFLKDLVRIKNI